MSLRIGIDMGGVCCQKDKEYEQDPSQEIKDDTEMNMPGCVEALEKLREAGHYLVLVSFCGAKRADSTRKRMPLDKYFHEVYFVKKRHFKEDVCKARGLDLLIDDRLDILSGLKSATSVHFKTNDRYEDVKGFHPDYTVSGWVKVLELIPRLRTRHANLTEVDPKLIYQ